MGNSLYRLYTKMQSKSTPAGIFVLRRTGVFALRSVTPRLKFNLYTSLNEVQTCARDTRHSAVFKSAIQTTPAGNPANRRPTAKPK